MPTIDLPIPRPLGAASAMPSDASDPTLAEAVERLTLMRDDREIWGRLLSPNDQAAIRVVLAALPNESTRATREQILAAIGDAIWAIRSYGPDDAGARSIATLHGLATALAELRAAHVEAVERATLALPESSGDCRALLTLATTLRALLGTDGRGTPTPAPGDSE